MNALMWMALWVLLFAGQWGLLVYQQETRSAKDARRGDASTRILPLIHAAELAWLELLPDSSPPDGFSAPSSPLIRRERARLALGELEGNLRLAGASVSIASDLEGWLDAASGRLLEVPDSAYVDGLTDWYAMSLEAEGTFVLEHSRLDPGTRSPWPDIAFAAEGSPSELGRRISQFLRDHPSWSLGELDLVCVAETGRWWIRGNWIFNKDTTPR